MGSQVSTTCRSSTLTMGTWHQKIAFGLLLLAFTAEAFNGFRVKRQDSDDEEEDTQKRICEEAGAEAGEWFGLQAIRCPAGLAFDIEKQTCNWRAAVKNCELRTKENKVKPLLYTDEPICQDAHLACGDGNCIEQAKFCNGEKDCNDGSDENACDINSDPNRAPPCDRTICKLPDCF